MSRRKGTTGRKRGGASGFTLEKLLQVASQTVRENAEPLVDSPHMLKRLVDGDEISCTFYGYGAPVNCSVSARKYSLQDLCTCNATYFCRHAAALVLTYLDRPETFLDLEAHLDGLSALPREALEEQLRQVIGRYPASSLEALGQEGFDPTVVLDEPEDDDLLSDPDDFLGAEDLLSGLGPDKGLDGLDTPPFEEYEDLDDFDDPGSRGDLN